MILNKCKSFLKSTINPFAEIKRKTIVFLLCFFSPVIFASPFNIDYPVMRDTVTIKELGALNLATYLQNEYEKDRWDVEKNGPPPSVVSFDEGHTFSITPIVEENNFIALHYIYKSGYSSTEDGLDLDRLQTYLYQKDGFKWVLMKTIDSLVAPSELGVATDAFSFSSYFPLSDLSQAMPTSRKEALQKRLLDKNLKWYERLLQTKRELKALDWFDLSVGETSNELQVALAVVAYEKGVRLHWLRKNEVQTLARTFPKETSFKSFILKDKTLIFTVENKEYLGTFAWPAKESRSNYFLKYKKDGKYERFPKGSNDYYNVKDIEGAEDLLDIISSTKNSYFYDNSRLNAKSSHTSSSLRSNKIEKFESIWLTPDINNDGVKDFLKTYTNNDDRYGQVFTPFHLFISANKKFQATDVGWEDYMRGADVNTYSASIRHFLSFDMNAKPYPKIILKGYTYKGANINGKWTPFPLSRFTKIYQWDDTENKIKLISSKITDKDKLEKFKKESWDNHLALPDPYNPCLVERYDWCPAK